MRIILQQVSKSYGRETVVRDLSHILEPGSRTALLGPNGSGKSTLLQVIAGASIPTKGTVRHILKGVGVDPEDVYRHISIAAPYLNLYEDLSLREAIGIHGRFKPFRDKVPVEEVARIALVHDQLEKPVRNFSSGMKQRLKLVFAILSDTPLLLLDEPTSNLDASGIAWFKTLLQQHVEGRTLVVASNRQEDETFACDSIVEVTRSR